MKGSKLVMPRDTENGWPALWRKADAAYRGHIIPLQGKEPMLPGGEGLFGWRDYVMTPQVMAACAAAGMNIGIRAGRLLFIDIDVDDAELAQIVSDTIERQLGRTVIRRRSNSPRRALVYWQPDDPVRAKWTILIRDAAGAERGKVEVLTYGQQILWLGVHPSGAPLSLTTPDGMDPFTKPEALPRIDVADVDQSVEALGGRLGALNMRLEIHKAGEAGAATAVHDPRHMASDMVRLKECINSIPNETINDRGKWVAIMHAIKGACGGDDVFFEDVVLPWCLRWTGAPAEDVEAEARRVWSSIRDVKHGADRLEAIARDYGYRGGPLRNDLLPLPEPAAAHPDDDWLGLPLREPQVPSQEGAPGAAAVPLKDDIGIPSKADQYDIAQVFIRSGGTERSRWCPSLGYLYFDRLWHGEDAQERLHRQVSDFMKLAGYPYVDDHRVNGVMKMLRGRMLVNATALDSDPALIGLPDGALIFGDPADRARRALASVQVKPVPGLVRVFEAPPVPGLMLTRSLGVPLGDPNETRIFDEWLAGWSNGRPDVARTMEELMARGLAPEPHGEYLFNAIGETQNGKSLYVALLRTIYGHAEGMLDNAGRLIKGYAAVPEYSTFAAIRNADGSRHRADLAVLRVARVIIVNEAEAIATAVWDGPFIKRITSGEPINARVPNAKEPLTFPLARTVIAVSNHPLAIKLDAALARRLFVVPFDRTFTQDDEVKARMLREFRQWGPNILARLVKVAERTCGDVSRPQAVEDATSAMLGKLDSLLGIAQEAFICGWNSEARGRRMLTPEIVKRMRDTAEKLGTDELAMMTDKSLETRLPKTLRYMGATKITDNNVRGYDHIMPREESWCS